MKRMEKPKSCHKWQSRYNVRSGTQKLLPWSKDVLYFMMQQQYDSFLLHSSALEFERDFFMDEPLRLPSYHPQWHQGILHSVRYPRYPPDEHPLNMQNAMLRLTVPRPIIRNALQITTTGLLDVIYDTGAVMTMITDHGTGYMTNKRETTHQVTGCLNEKPRGGLHIANFNFLLRMENTTEGYNGWFHIIAPQTLAVPPEYETSDLLQ